MSDDQAQAIRDLMQRVWNAEGTPPWIFLSIPDTAWPPDRARCLWVAAHVQRDAVVKAVRVVVWDEPEVTRCEGASFEWVPEQATRAEDEAVICAGNPRARVYWLVRTSAA